jgi:2-oxoglutarate ferredoxin oxidoreductase subunit beta
VTFVPKYEEIQAEYEPGEVIEVRLHDGSILVLKKIEREYDPTNRLAAIQLLEDARAKQILATGLIYYSAEQASLQDSEGLIERPLAELQEGELRPAKESLETVMADFR